MTPKPVCFALQKHLFVIFIAVCFLPGVVLCAPYSQNILLIGLDGATWYAMKPLIQMGQLPVIEKISQHGAYGNLISVPGAKSPVIWTSVATGKLKEKHGIVDFTFKDKDTYNLQPPCSFHRKVSALWNMATVNDRSTGFVNWWASWPSELVNGYVLSYNLFHIGNLKKDLNENESSQLTYPPNLLQHIHCSIRMNLDDLEEEVAFICGHPVDRAHWELIEDRTKDVEFLQVKEFSKSYIYHQIFEFTALDGAVARAAMVLAERNEVNIRGLYFQGIDALGHMFWKFYEPSNGVLDYQTSEADILEFGRVYANYYRHTDRFLAEILDEVEDNTSLLVCSDHGMGIVPPSDISYQYSLNSLYEKLGWLKQNDGQIDWSETLLYDAHAFQAWRSDRKNFLNVKGRESHGIIEPGEEFEQLRNTMIETLRNIRTTSGKSLFIAASTQCLEKDQRNEGSIDADIWVYMNPDLKPDDKIVIGAEQIPITEFMIPRIFSGNHTVKGIFMAALKNIESKKRVTNVSYFDITPTILALNGMPVGKDMDGKILTQIFTNKFRQSCTPRYIDSYDNGDRDIPESQDTALNEDTLERLRKLGYIR